MIGPEPINVLTILTTTKTVFTSQSVAEGGVLIISSEHARLKITYPFMVFQLPQGWTWFKFLLSMQKFHFKFDSQETLPFFSISHNEIHLKLVFSQGYTKEQPCLRFSHQMMFNYIRLCLIIVPAPNPIGLLKMNRCTTFWPTLFLQRL